MHLISPLEDQAPSPRQKVAFDQGYDITIKRSIRDHKVWLGCDRGGVYRNSLNLNENTRRRATSSRCIGCPFEMYARKKGQ
ncbi:hypothetical protein PsorP6_009718 [Peronosclerospora sorghi]|uniref:Uncharacterized protein n=1 Tax=Peronosclerospora sorghi TaxID=230839 RepID=A0ACC0W243_9STRA|nr:hypothetical protein PsorP6_009718 [Peronosclerospora sorghi]